MSEARPARTGREKSRSFHLNINEMLAVLGDYWNFDKAMMS